LIKIFKYTGELLQKIEFFDTELYHVEWLRGVDKYRDRPISPKMVEKNTNTEGQKNVTNLDSLTKNEELKPNNFAYSRKWRGGKKKSYEFGPKR